MQKLRAFAAILIWILAVSPFAVDAQDPQITFTWPTLSATGTTNFLLVKGNDVHTVQAVVTGSPASCTMNLDGSVDNIHWYDLSGAQTCTSNIMFHVVSRSVLYVRGNVTALSAAATATITYSGHSTGK